MKDVVVTGANGGIGYAATRRLAERGYRVCMAVRDTEKGHQARERIRRAVPGADLDVMQLDLSDLSSVRNFAAAYRGRNSGPDVLVNNAGVMALPRQMSVDGHELHFATNHLGHFALTGLLLGGMRATPAPRVVTVASLMHRIGRIDFDDVNREHRYSKWLTYSSTKLMNLLFAIELQRRADEADVPLVSLAVHPGYSSTGLVFAGPRMSGSTLKVKAYGLLNRLVGQDADGVARPTVSAVTDAVPAGAYLGPSGAFEIRGAPRAVRASRRARDVAIANQLWALSERLSGVTFNFDH